jgi:hypothetical protein
MAMFNNLDHKFLCLEFTWRVIRIDLTSKRNKRKLAGAKKLLILLVSGSQVFASDVDTVT